MIHILEKRYVIKFSSLFLKIKKRRLKGKKNYGEE